MSVTWYLSVFGHGAEKARLNPFMMYSSHKVTPGRRTANSTKTSTHADVLDEMAERDATCENKAGFLGGCPNRMDGRGRRTSRRPVAPAAAACHRRRAAARRTPVDAPRSRHRPPRLRGHAACRRRRRGNVGGRPPDAAGGGGGGSVPPRRASREELAGEMKTKGGRVRRPKRASRISKHGKKRARGTLVRTKYRSRNAGGDEVRSGQVRLEGGKRWNRKNQTLNPSSPPFRSVEGELLRPPLRPGEFLAFRLRDSSQFPDYHSFLLLTRRVLRWN